MRIAILAVVITTFATATLAGPGAGAIVQAFNTDAASEGMGGGSSSVWWHAAPDPWGNPAMLGYHNGVSYHHMYSQLAAGLADDIEITSDRLTLGWGGFGVMIQAGPVDTYLDMGTQMATDEEGNVQGTVDSFEESTGLGLGFSTAGVLRKLRPESKSLNLLARHFDLAAGMVRKSYESELVGDGNLQDLSGGSATATMTDYGVLARASLYNSLDGPGLLPEFDRAIYPVISGWRVTAAYGRSWLNWGDDMIDYEGANQADPMPREYRSGKSLRLEVGLPGALKDNMPEVVAEMLSPMIAVSKSWEDRWPGYVWDNDANVYRYEEDESDDFLEEMDGWELTVLGLVSVRGGHTKVEYGDIDGDTEGWGVHLNLAGVQARYDHATVPQATGLRTVDRESWSVVVDVMRLLDRD